MAMQELGNGLWLTHRRLRFLAIETGTRMTLVRVSSGGLLVHSPVPLDDAPRVFVDGLTVTDASDRAASLGVEPGKERGGPGSQIGREMLEHPRVLRGHVRVHGLFMGASWLAGASEVRARRTEEEGPPIEAAAQALGDLWLEDGWIWAPPEIDR